MTTKAVSSERTLLLGRGGFIGTAISRTLCVELPSWTHSHVGKAECDLTEQSSVSQLVKQFSRDTVLILCAGIKRQYGDTMEIFEQNITMVANVCRALQQAPVKRIVYLSSAGVYGEEIENTAICERTPLNPGSLYGVGKFACERLLERVAAETKATIVHLRPPLVYGRGDTSNGYGPAGFELNALERRDIVLWGEGAELREFLYVGDLARIVAELVPLEWSGILNPVSGRSRTYRECAELVRRYTGSPIQILERPRSRPKVDHVYHSGLLSQVLPSFRFTPLEDGLSEMLSTATQPSEQQ